MKYRCIADFGSLVAGDVIEERNGAYVFEERVNLDGFTSYRYAEFDKEAIEEEVKEGRLTPMVEYCDCPKNVVNDTMTLLNELENKYNTDYAALMHEYEQGNFPTAAQVEAATVYANLQKLVTTIKKSLNGEKVKITD